MSLQFRGDLAILNCSADVATVIFMSDAAPICAHQVLNARRMFPRSTGCFSAQALAYLSWISSRSGSSVCDDTDRPGRVLALANDPVGAGRHMNRLMFFMFQRDGGVTRYAHEDRVPHGITE